MAKIRDLALRDPQVLIQEIIKKTEMNITETDEESNEDTSESQSVSIDEESKSEIVIDSIDATPKEFSIHLEIMDKRVINMLKRNSRRSSVQLSAPAIDKKTITPPPKREHSSQRSVINLRRTKKSIKINGVKKNNEDTNNSFEVSHSYSFSSYTDMS